MTVDHHYDLYIEKCKHSLTRSQLLNVVGDIVALLRDTPIEQDPSQIMHCAVDVVGFGLSSRACNVLAFGGVRTVGELVSKTSLDLLKMRHCGARTLREIRLALRKFGLALSGETAEVLS